LRGAPGGRHITAVQGDVLKIISRGERHRHKRSCEVGPNDAVSGDCGSYAEQCPGRAALVVSPGLKRRLVRCQIRCATWWELLPGIAGVVVGPQQPYSGGTAKCRDIPPTDSPAEHFRLQIKGGIEEYSVSPCLESEVANKRILHLGMVGCHHSECIAQPFPYQDPRSSARESRLSYGCSLSHSESCANTVISWRGGFGRDDGHGIHRGLEGPTGLFGKVDYGVERGGRGENVTGPGAVPGACHLGGNQQRHHSAG
jgi:hypothetical protein